jgi:mono/diheme cytochrome c family protein
MKKIMLTLVTTAAIGLLAVGAVVGIGLYDVSATDQHLRPTYWLIEMAMRRSVNLRAHTVEVPALDDPARIERGLVLYRDHCVQCHGGPGVAPEPFSLGLTPAAANLVHTARAWAPAEMFWVVRNGLKMTGMPAWKFRLSEDDLWAVVAFVATLPDLSPVEYRARATAVPPSNTPDEERGPAEESVDPERGKQAIQQYACVTCHEIPGIVGAVAPVGPPLNAMAKRAWIAGIVPNNFENMVRWLQDPQRIAPKTAMPDLRVTERDARDMAAYLATLR